MALYLVRHAKAGSRDKWEGDDRERPLTRNGRAQADGLVALFAGSPVTRLVSSPYVRCVQTLEPLARARGLAVELDARLAEGSALVDALALLDELDDGAVLCSHGDVIPDVIAALERRGTDINGVPDWRKGATWVIAPDRSQASALSPPC